MVHRGGLMLVCLSGFLACSPAQSEKVPAQRSEEVVAVVAEPEEVVAVVAEPKYYVSGAVGDEEMQLFNEADPKRMWKVDGFIFEVIKPPEYAGRIIGMHHDGVLASGDPYTLWEVGRRYEFKISKENIGKLSFGPCSLHGTRKVLPK